MYSFEMATFGSDQPRHLDLRSVVGGGIGSRIIDRPEATLDVFSGGTFEESFRDHANRNCGELLTGAELAYKLLNRTSMWHRLAMFPNMSEPGDYRLNLDSSVILKFNSWLGWQSNMTEMSLLSN